MIRMISTVVLISLWVLGASDAVGQGPPWGPPECRVLSIANSGWFQPVDVEVHSTLTDPDAEGLVRQAGGQNPLDGPKQVPQGTFPGETHTFHLGPPMGGWVTDVIYMFEFYVVKNGNWYRTIVAFIFVGNGQIEIWDVYENSGVLD